VLDSKAEKLLIFGAKTEKLFSIMTKSAKPKNPKSLSRNLLIFFSVQIPHLPVSNGEFKTGNNKRSSAPIQYCIHRLTLSYFDGLINVTTSFSTSPDIER